jgi:hypothetical protein
MSAQARLLAVYEELSRLSKEAVAALAQGARPESLDAQFERKAALARELSQISPPEAMEPVEGRSKLLEAQRNAALAEAELVKALQPFVSSNGNRTKMEGSKPAPKSGQRWDLLG